MKKLLVSCLTILSVFLLVGCRDTANNADNIASALKSGKYANFSAEKMAELKGKQKFVVFFHAQWCGTCRKWESMITEKMSKLPLGTIILKADFDTETELAKQLNVTKQSTAVFFDATGEVLRKELDPSFGEIYMHFSHDKTEVARNDGKYQIFSAEKIGQGTPVLVFFHAEWCGTCRKWETNLLKNINTLSDTTVIMKADFDTNIELRKKYNVKMQSTGVFLDESGAVVATVVDPSVKALQEFFGTKATEPETVAENTETAPVLPDTVPSYEIFSAEKFASLQGKQVFGVYFKADWCPICQVFDGKISSSINTFPRGTIILKADYDKETDLKKQLGVTKQTTIVILDETGVVKYREANPPIADVKSQFVVTEAASETELEIPTEDQISAEK